MCTLRRHKPQGPGGCQGEGRGTAWFRRMDRQLTQTPWPLHPARHTRVSGEPASTEMVSALSAQEPRESEPQARNVGPGSAGAGPCGLAGPGDSKSQARPLQLRVAHDAGPGCPGWPLRTPVLRVRPGPWDIPSRPPEQLPSVNEQPAPATTWQERRLRQPLRRRV